MMNGSDWGYNMTGGYWLACAILWLVILVDLILLGVWLWKQIQKK